MLAGRGSERSLAPFPPHGSRLVVPTLPQVSSRPQRLLLRAPFVLHAVAFGVALQVRASSQVLLDELRVRLPYSSEITQSASSSVQWYTLLDPDSGRGFRLFGNGRKIAEDAEAEHVLHRFAGAAMLHVAEHAPEFIFVHAGVIALRGRAMIFPGRSLSGKSTLVAEFVRAGALYYSDEYAVLDSAGFVHPFARDLQMRKPGGREQTSVAVEAFGGVAGRTPLRVASVHFTRYRTGCTWRPLTIPTGQGVLQTLRHAVAMRRSPARVLSTLTSALSEAAVYSCSRGEADGTAAAMLAQR